MHITAEKTQTYDLYKSDTARSYDSTLFEILPTQHEVKRQNRSNDQTENGKCKNVTNRRSRVASQPHFDYFTLSNSPRCFGGKHMAATGVYDKAIRKNT